jgi:hypothetical protein
MHLSNHPIKYQLIEWRLLTVMAFRLLLLTVTIGISLLCHQPLGLSDSWPNLLQYLDLALLLVLLLPCLHLACRLHLPNLVDSRLLTLGIFELEETHAQSLSIPQILRFNVRYLHCSQHYIIQFYGIRSWRCLCCATFF